MVDECRTRQDFDALVASSYTRPMFIFKHSTRCPISAGRWREYENWAGKRGDVGFARVLVIEDRSVSSYVAERSGVGHQSPQAILFYRGEPVWNASHWSITEQDMAEAVRQAASS